jgi:hypothetical protein
MPYKSLEDRRACNRQWMARWRAQHSDLAKARDAKWQKENPEAVHRRNIKWNAANPEKRRAAGRKWRSENAEYSRARVRAWFAAHPDYVTSRYKNDTQFRLASMLRARLSSAIRNKQKTGSAVRDLGCSIKELMLHIEAKFDSGMTWENQGKWHLDHIIPLSAFDLSVREQFLSACHYTNLQPLWAEDNLRKHASLLVDKGVVAQKVAI